LAGHLKKMVSEIEQEMSHSEFMEWVAFSKIEPIGDARLDFLAGSVQHTQVACTSTSKHKLSDFIPDWLGERAAGQKQTPEMLAAILGGLVTKQRK
jgi:hypothetical protein